ncbi:unnamed protein product [Enterobius vermicularis]|uniref:Non-specific serine/threonine protein kinase n=1 Tax=Enterobius vermicularis TaxID=51028 RepID=A0A0N4VEB7_ENTVE|nr:unnamed protein product [Enterobius vermicularis]
MFEKTKYCVNLDFSKLKMYLEFSESVLGESRALVFEENETIFKMMTRLRRRSLDNDSENVSEQKTVSQRARELLSRHRKRLTLSGGRRSRPLDTLDEVENCSEVSCNSVSPPKKAKRVLGIVSPNCGKADDSRGSTEKVILTTPNSASKKSRELAPLATLCDDLEGFNASPCSSSNAGKMFSTPASKPVSLDQSFKTRTREGTPLRSIPSSIGRSLSALRSAGRSLHLLKVQASVASLNSIPHSDLGNNNDLCSLERTPTKSSLAIVRQLSSSSVSRAANALLKGFVTGPRSNRSRIRHRISLKEESPRENRCRFSTVGTEEDRLQRQHERYNALKSAIHIVKEEIVELATTEEVLYDAIVCDITPSCKPISKISKIIMERVGEEVIDDIETELILKKKFILTESDIFFVIDYGTPGHLEKTWQDMRFVFHNFIEKAIEHGGISSLLLPYLYTGEPPRDQEKVANAAISSINHLAQQIGLGNISKFHIGGVADSCGCYEHYLTAVEKLLSSIAPPEAENILPIEGSGDVF